MPHSAYPTGDEIGAYLESLGILTEEALAALSTGTTLDDLAAAAQAAWEADTGWRPFLRDASPVSRRFTPPGPNMRGLTRGGRNLLDLEAGLLEVTGFVTGYAADDTGDAVVVEDDYYLGPANAGVDGRPYTSVDLVFTGWGLPQSIRITGYWGYSQYIPADAWEAIKRYGVLLAYSEITLSLTGGMVGWSEADIKEQYDLTPLEKHREAWDRQWQRAVNRYRRPYL
jgi:hypothetical protein